MTRAVTFDTQFIHCAKFRPVLPSDSHDSCCFAIGGRPSLGFVHGKSIKFCACCNLDETQKLLGKLPQDLDRFFVVEMVCLCVCVFGYVCAVGVGVYVCGLFVHVSRSIIE